MLVSGCSLKIGGRMNTAIKKVLWEAKVVKDIARPGFYKWTGKAKRLTPDPPIGRMLIPMKGDCFINIGESIPMFTQIDDHKGLEKIVDLTTNNPCGHILNAAKRKDKSLPFPE